MTRQVALAADRGALAQGGGLVQVPSRQRYARYVGRVGALAVALGVGASMPVAYADRQGSDGSAGSSSTGSSSSGSGSESSDSPAAGSGRRSHSGARGAGVSSPAPAPSVAPEDVPDSVAVTSSGGGSAAADGAGARSGAGAGTGRGSSVPVVGGSGGHFSAVSAGSEGGVLVSRGGRAEAVVSPAPAAASGNRSPAPVPAASVVSVPASVVSGGAGVVPVAAAAAAAAPVMSAAPAAATGVVGSLGAGWLSWLSGGAGDGVPWATPLAWTVLAATRRDVNGSRGTKAVAATITSGEPAGLLVDPADSVAAILDFTVEVRGGVCNPACSPTRTGGYLAPWDLETSNVFLQGFLDPSTTESQWVSGSTKLEYVETASLNFEPSWFQTVKISSGTSGKLLPRVAFVSLGDQTIRVYRGLFSQSYTVRLARFNNYWNAVRQAGGTGLPATLSISPADSGDGFGTRQLEVFFSPEYAPRTDQLTMRTSNFVDIPNGKAPPGPDVIGGFTDQDRTTAYTQWRAIYEEGSDGGGFKVVKLAYFGGLANYMYLNGITNPGNSSGYGKDVQITIDEDYQTGSGAGSYNLSSEVAVLKGVPGSPDKVFTAEEALDLADTLNKKYWGKGYDTTSVTDTNLKSGPTEPTAPEFYLDANKLTPPEVFAAIDPSLQTWKTPNGGPSPVWDFYTMTTTGRVSINGSGEISGYGVQGTYNWVGSNPPLTYYSMWADSECRDGTKCPYVNLGDNYGASPGNYVDPLYRISAGFLTANSTHVSSNVDNDAAIDLAGPTVSWGLRQGFGAVRLNVAPNYIGSQGIEIKQGVPGGDPAAANTIKIVVPFASPNTQAAFQASPVKIYDFKQLASWINQADGPSWQGKGSIMQHSFIHAADDSVKMEGLNSTAYRTTVLQGGSGAAAGNGYSLVNGGTNTVVDGLFVHRIVHGPLGFDYDRGVVSVQINPNTSLHYQEDPNYNITVRDLYVPSLRAGWLSPVDMNLVQYGVTMTAGNIIRGFAGAPYVFDGTPNYDSFTNIQINDRIRIQPRLGQRDVFWVYGANGPSGVGILQPGGQQYAQLRMNQVSCGFLRGRNCYVWDESGGNELDNPWNVLEMPFYTPWDLNVPPGGKLAKVTFLQGAVNDVRIRVSRW